MSEFDLVVRGGTIATASDQFRADIGVRDGRIVQIGLELGDAAKDLDATGRLVLPGGVDAHVHLAQPTSDGTVMADDFDTGTRAAAAGGTTTVLPFALQEKGKSLRQAVLDYHEKARGNCHVDISFHLIISDPTPQVLGQELPALIHDGYSSFKVFMTYDDLMLTDAELLDVFEVARREGALVMVHAEGHDAIRHMTRKLEESGRTQPYYHAIAHSEIAEREATHRAISHAQLVDVPIMIVHVSGRDPMEQIQWARRRGLKVHAETCPQYIALTRDDLKGLNMDFEGAKYVCSPPPRDIAAQEAIWEGLRDGTFDIFSSDHAPFRYKGEAGTGKDNPRARTSFKWVPNGIPGIETRLPILFSEGVSKGLITLERFVALTSTTPARLYGLYPRKGAIIVGGDADMVIWDPLAERTITQTDLHHGSDYTPYEGMRVVGWPETVILRGQVVSDRGNLNTAARRGMYLDRFK